MKKYSAKYFGLAAGVLSVMLFLIVLINDLLSNNNDIESALIPFIPFLTSISILTVIGGTIVSFLWGVFLGYLFIVIYNFYDKTLVKRTGND